MDVEEILYQSNWKQILIELVIKNKLNPWDLDLEILALKIKEKIANLDFKVSGDLLLAYAIILKYKTLMISVPEYDAENQNIDLKRELIRPSRKVPITLNYLIKFIKKSIRKYKKRKNKPRNQNIYDIQPIEEIKEIITINEEDFNLKLKNFLNFIEKEVFLSNIPGDLLENFLSMLLLSNEGKIEFKQEKAFDDILIIKVMDNG